MRSDHSLARTPAEYHHTPQSRYHQARAARCMTHNIHHHQSHRIIRNKHSLWPVLCAEQHLGRLIGLFGTEMPTRPKAQIKAMICQTGAESCLSVPLG